MSKQDSTSHLAAPSNAVASSVAGGATDLVRESFAGRFLKRNGYLYCTRCYTKVLPTDHPHSCPWRAR